MMSQDYEQNQRQFFDERVARIARAHARVEKRTKIWSWREDRYALVRLLVTAIMLVLLVGFYRKLNAAELFSGWICFFIFFFALSAIHRRLKRVRSRCEGLGNVFSAEVLRLQRNWVEIRRQTSLHFQSFWQHVSQNHTDHPYRTDFDITQLPALWLDTCTLEEGSFLLAEELLLRGRQPLTDAELHERTRDIDKLARQSQALRRWESYRFAANAKDLSRVKENDEKAEEGLEEGTDKIENDSQRELRRKILEGVLWILVLIQLVVWTGFFLPQLLNFLNSAEIDQLSRPVSLFIPLLLLSAVVWEAWRKKVQQADGSLGLRELKVLNALEDVQKCISSAQEKVLVPVTSGRRFRFLRTTFELGEVRRNPIAWILFNIIVPYDALTFAVTLMAHRAIDGRFQDWWRDVVKFDFNAALARVQLENPEFTRAQLNAEKVMAEQLAHPLLPAHQRIANDFVLSASDQRCMLLTGSNMAGKSTLLRALGMNALLAQMGAVVSARRFVSPQLEILCAIQVSDSLESGASYFYAEVQRLARVLQKLKENSGGTKKLFLIDEIFRGTNNRERFLGSWQVISALLKTGAFGVLTTHDLALTRLESEVEGVRNFHLRETVGEQGRLEFDYLLRMGPCPTTNALIIMQQAGLPVDLNFQPSRIEGS